MILIQGKNSPSISVQKFINRINYKTHDNKTNKSNIKLKIQHSFMFINLNITRIHDNYRHHPPKL